MRSFSDDPFFIVHYHTENQFSFHDFNKLAFTSYVHSSGGWPQVLYLYTGTNSGKSFGKKPADTFLCGVLHQCDHSRCGIDRNQP